MNFNGLKIEEVDAVLVDNTGVALAPNFGSAAIHGVLVREMNNSVVAIEDLKWAVSAGVITVTANFAGNVTRTCKLYVFIRE